MKKLLFFAIAGGTGFVVDVVVLFIALHYTPIGPYFGRMLAIAAAMACTWYINRRFTFDASGHSLAAEGARYYSVGMTSAGINYVIYSALLLFISGISPFIALVLGSASATVFSYLGYSKFVFGGGNDEEEQVEQLAPVSQHANHKD